MGSCTMILIISLLVLCAQFYEVTMETKPNEEETKTNGGELVMFIDAGFTCNDGSHIRTRHLCDGKKDCSQNEDEDHKECSRKKPATRRGWGGGRECIGRPGRHSCFLRLG